MPVIIAALIMALLGGASTVLAAHEAQPGDALYGVKRAVERIEAASATDSLEAKSNRSITKQNSSRAKADDEDADEAADEDASEAKGAGHGRALGHSDAISATVAISSTVAVTLTKTFSDVVAAAEQMPGKSENGLNAKLRVVEKSLTKGHVEPAQHQIDAFINQAGAACRSGHLDDAQYNTLYGDYSQLISGIGGTPQPSAGPCADKSNVESGDDDAASGAESERGASQSGERGQGQGKGNGQAGAPEKSSPGKSGSAPGRTNRR